MKNHCGELVGFSFRAALWFLQWFCLCEVSETNVMLSFNLDLLAISTVKCTDSVSFSFLFPCFLLLMIGQIFISLCDCNRVWITAGSEYCMQLIVWTLNMNYDRKEWRNSVSFSVSCRHFQTIFLGLLLENRVSLLFAWIKAKEWWRHWTALMASQFRCYWQRE